MVRFAARHLIHSWSLAYYSSCRYNWPQKDEFNPRDAAADAHELPLPGNYGEVLARPQDYHCRNPPNSYGNNCEIHRLYGLHQ